ncbi:MAG: ATP-dependent Clp protease proteolytic subunit [Candidatus Eremiobacteraeota bacterium]|nr:ATP-dependent Clp protease proteolytic subunit [Candidatus Eremiobacteraeota bacterium]
MNARRLRATLWIALLLVGFIGMGMTALSSAPSGQVEVIHIDGTVDDGMAHLVQRGIADANADHARAIVLDINSGGGLVEAAFLIRDAIFSAKEPVIAYVDGRAYSAAALIALAANRIVMGPGASIGAAEPIPNTGKMISALRGEFESTALRNHRSANVAGAMVDKNVDLSDYKHPGAILTLNTQDALRAHIADATAPTLDAAIASSNLQGVARVEAGYTLGEQIARFATDPIVSGLLLTIGMLGLLIEMQTLHGIAGVIGVMALVLFFGTHIYAGFSNGLVVVLAIAGILGILFELHVVPGHGLPGILGGVLLIAAVALAFGLQSYTIAAETMATAVVLTVILFALAVRAFAENAWMRRLTLLAEQGPDYVTSADFTYLRGRTGTAASLLRPAGVASIDGRRVDVLTSGEFIAVGTPVRVTRVEGARIFVEPVTLPSYKE